MLKYSFVVPIFNVENYIVECIESLIHQTYSKIEIILVDDGSNDNCPEICDKYAIKDKRVKVIHKLNGGLVSARKSGAKIATGDYICCVDGDDYVDKDYILKFHEVLQYKHYDIVCCGYFRTNKTEKIKQPLNYRHGEYSKKQMEDEIYPLLIQSSSAKAFPPNVWAKAFKKEIYFNYQMSVEDNISMGEDGAVTIPMLAQANNIFILGDCLYYYRYNPTSMTKIKKPLSWNGLIAVLFHLYNIVPIEKYDFTQQMYRRVVHSFFNTAKSQFFRKEPYCKIKKEIIAYMNKPIFSDAIKKCKFSESWQAKLITFLLRHKILFPLKIISKIK